MDTNKRMFRFLNYDLILGSLAFWGIMLLINIISIFMQHIITSNILMGPVNQGEFAMSFVGTNFIAVLVFFIVYGLEMYYENFSLAVGFGGTRKNFYINVLISNLLVAIIFSSIQMVLLKLDNFLVSSLGYKPLENYGFFNTSDNLLNNILVLTFLLLVLASLTNLLGVMQYRFGYKFWIGLGVLILIGQMIFNFLERFIMSVVDIEGFVNTIIEDIPSISFPSKTYLIGLFIISISYLIGYLFIRRADIK